MLIMKILTWINRYIMECKWGSGINRLPETTWINRYIMECKLQIQKDEIKSSFRINRYIMECKLIWFWLILAGMQELIDTLWNVNIFKKAWFSIVNRINRYIMECKLNLKLPNYVFIMWINRYIMECKLCSAYR